MGASLRTNVRIRQRINVRMRIRTNGVMANPMKEAFRESLIEHLERHQVSLAELARETGVSLPQLQKLSQRRTVAPNVHDAVRIARYFGKSVEAFCGEEENAELESLLGLIARLTPEQREIVEAQIAGIFARRRR
ncbi:UNVERIFIED_CONTAM: hypothetical protein BEN50_25730 [Euhalothece sp. KZN 001]